MSTPTSVTLPEGVQRTKLDTSRGVFAALEAVPTYGVCDKDTALLVPGYTGSKEDFIAVLDLLAAAGRRVFAIDMRGQYQSPGAADPAAYSPAALGADIAAAAEQTGARHLLGHSYGGLITREAVLAGLDVTSFALMSSGPAALTGPRAAELRAMLTAIGADRSVPGAEPIAKLWESYLEPQAVTARVPAAVVSFLRDRMLSNDPNGLVLMARHLLSAADRTSELARIPHLPMLVVYGEDDNSWSPRDQEEMAARLGAQRVCIPGAMHSPNVEAPATTASTLTTFWDAAEARLSQLSSPSQGRRRTAAPPPSGQCRR